MLGDKKRFQTLHQMQTSHISEHDDAVGRMEPKTEITDSIVLIFGSH